VEAGERVRAQAQAEALDPDQVGRQDDFHLLGADSLSALRLFEAISRDFGIELPLVELLQSPTIAQLAARLDAGDLQQATTTSIVTLRAPESAGNRAADKIARPLYLPPSMGGELLYWRELVRALAPGRPVYGLALPADCEDPADLHAVAAALVRDLIAHQPQGPYHLAGYSFSAAVAFEMAQQLRASGREVGVLAMIDYGPGLPEGLGTRLRTVGYFFANLPWWLRYDILQSNWADFVSRVRRKLANAGGRMWHYGRPNAAREAERAVEEMFDQQELPDTHRKLVIDQLDAYYRYQPVAYGGRILLFWARCRPLLHSLAPDLGWALYAGDGYRRIIVRCNHDNILDGPHAGAIATALDEAMRGHEQPERRKR